MNTEFGSIFIDPELSRKYTWSLIFNQTAAETDAPLKGETLPK